MTRAMMKSRIGLLVVTSTAISMCAAAIGSLGHCFEQSGWTSNSCDGVMPMYTGGCLWIRAGVTYRPATSSLTGTDTVSPVSTQCLIYPTTPVLVGNILVCVAGTPDPIEVSYGLATGGSCPKPPPPTPGPPGEQ